MRVGGRERGRGRQGGGRGGPSQSQLTMSLWRTWEVYDTFTFFVSGKEYRSKTDVTHIEKTNTNVTCNNCQAKYNDSKCKTTDLLQAMTCIASKWLIWKEIVFLTISHFWNAKDWADTDEAIWLLVFTAYSVPSENAFQTLFQNVDTAWPGSFSENDLEMAFCQKFVCKLKKRRNLKIISGPQDLLLNTFKNLDKKICRDGRQERLGWSRTTGNKETKKGRGLVTGGMGNYSRCCEKIEEGFRRDEGFAREISTSRWLMKISLSLFSIFCLR